MQHTNTRRKKNEVEEWIKINFNLTFQIDPLYVVSTLVISNFWEGLTCWQGAELMCYEYGVIEGFFPVITLP